MPDNRSWEPPAPQCALIVRTVEIPATPSSPDGWQVSTSENPSRHDLPGNHSAEASERLSTARAELVFELLRREQPIAATIQAGMEQADALAAQWRGVIVDPFAQRVVMPGEWQIRDKPYGLDPREHVTVQVVAGPSGLWVHTHGLVKFGRPELELFDLPPELERTAWAFVMDTSAYVMDGPVIAPGSTVGAPDRPLRALEGSREAEHWDGLPVVEFRGDGASTADALRAWAA